MMRACPRFRIAALAASGDVEAYTTLLVSLLELGHHVEESPASQISHLVGINMGFVALQSWQNSLPLVSLNDDQLLALQRALQQFELRNATVASQ